MFYLYTLQVIFAHLHLLSHPYSLSFIVPRSVLTVFFKLVLQRVAMKGAVSRTIFGLNFTCLREREVGGR